MPPATLNTRLRELREARLLEQDGGYRLTELGAELIAASAPLLRWSERWARALDQADSRVPAKRARAAARRG